MNRYLVLKQYEDPIHGVMPVGSFVMLEEKTALKLIKNGVVQLSEDLTMVDVAFRYQDLNLELYNTRTGNAMLRFNRWGILDAISANLIGNVTGDLTGNVTGDLTGNVTGDVAGDVTGQLFGAVTTYTEDGDIALTDLMSLLDGSANTCAMALANGTGGQSVTIKAVDVTNSCTVTPTGFADGISISLPAVGDSVTLAFDGTSWQVVNLSGTAAIVT